VKPLVVLLAATVAFAAAPSALVTAAGDLSINGRSVQTVGAPNWPASIGDTITTGKQGAVITLAGGGQLSLSPSTTIVLQASGGYRLLHGSCNQPPPPVKPCQPPNKSKHDNDDDHDDHGNHNGHHDDHDDHHGR
jgi:hypothetical protein